MREAMANLDAMMMQTSATTYPDYSYGLSGDTLQELTAYYPSSFGCYSSSSPSSMSSSSSFLSSYSDTSRQPESQLHTLEATKLSTEPSHDMKWALGACANEADMDGNFPPAGDPYLAMTGYAADSGVACVSQFSAAHGGFQQQPVSSGAGSFSPPPLPPLPAPTVTVPATGQRRARNKATKSNVPYVIGDFNAFTAPRDPTAEELEKERIKQEKAMNRKERNKAAARRSNLNKKLFRDHLEQKSVELCEQNLQLHQDIKALKNKIHHFKCVRYMMQHVCTQRHRLQHPQQQQQKQQQHHQQPVNDNTKQPAFFSPHTQSIAMSSF